MTPVQKLKDVFSNFEKSFSNISLKKVELSGSKTTITIDRWQPRNSTVRQGVNYDFVRFYQGTTKSTEELTFGFSFMFDDTKPIVIAIHDGLKRYRKEVSFDELKEGLKSLTKEIKEKEINGFLVLTILVQNAFNFNEVEATEYDVFDSTASEKAIEASKDEQSEIQKTKESLNILATQESSIRAERDKEIKEAIFAIEQKYSTSLDPIQEKIDFTLGLLEEKEIAYVEKLKTTFKNYDMTMEKFLMNLAKELPYPEAIVPHIIPKD